MSEIETHPAAEKPFCDPGKETQTPVINDKSDLAKHIDANRGSSNKNQTISRPTRNELSQFSESNRTKHQINSHKLSVVKPKAQVRKVKKKDFLKFPRQVIKRARSPVTVQEWVAALPDADTETPEDTEEERGLSLVRRQNTEASLADEADLVLGAEAGYTSASGGQVAKLMLQRNNGRPAAKRTLQHSDTAASFRSNISHLSTSR